MNRQVAAVKRFLSNHFLPLTILGTIIRLLLLPLTYHGDVQVNYIWGRFAYEFGLRGYYDWLNFFPWNKPNQPPISILIYEFLRFLYLRIFDVMWWINTHIPIFPSNIMSWYEEMGNQVILKIVGIGGEILLFILLYKIIKSIRGKIAARAYSLLFYLNPCLLYAGTIWGQSDALISFIGLASFFMLFNHYYLMAVFLFSLCLLTKASLAIWLPIFFITIVLQKGISTYKLLPLVIVPLLLAYVLSLPFAPTSPLPWLIDLYAQRIIPGEMPHLTANAFNLWAALFGPTPISDSKIFFNLPASLWGTIFFFVNITIIAILYLRRQHHSYNLFLTISLTTFASFLFLTRMHERYLFPAMAPLLIYSIKHPRIFKIYLILSLSHLVNLYNMWWFPKLSPLIAMLSHPLTIPTISIINLFLYFYLLRYFYDQK